MVIWRVWFAGHWFGGGGDGDSGGIITIIRPPRSIHTPLSISTQFGLAYFGMLGVIAIGMCIICCVEFRPSWSMCRVHVHDLHKQFSHSRNARQPNELFSSKMLKTFSNHPAYIHLVTCQHMHAHTNSFFCFVFYPNISTQTVVHEEGRTCGAASNRTHADFIKNCKQYEKSL